MKVFKSLLTLTIISFLSSVNLDAASPEPNKRKAAEQKDEKGHGKRARVEHCSGCTQEIQQGASTTATDCCKAIIHDNADCWGRHQIRCVVVIAAQDNSNSAEDPYADAFSAQRNSAKNNSSSSSSSNPSKRKADEQEHKAHGKKARKKEPKQNAAQASGKRKADEQESKNHGKKACKEKSGQKEEVIELDTKDLKKFPLEKLPDDLLISILSFVGDNKLISDISLTNKRINTLIKRKPKYVKELNLQNNIFILDEKEKKYFSEDISPEAIIPLESITKYTGLEKLTLNWVTNKKLIALIPYLSKLENWRYLHLNRNNITRLKTLKNLGSSETWGRERLRTIMAGNEHRENFTNRGFIALVPYLKKICHLKLDGFEDDNNSDDSDDDEDNNSDNDEDDNSGLANKILTALAHHNIDQLQYFTLTNSEATDKKFITFIPHLKDLRYLDISNSPNLTDATLIALAEHDINKLRYLNLSATGENYKYLRSPFTDIGIKALIPCLTKLKSLNINRCKKISSQALDELISACPKLQELHLQNLSEVTDNLLKVIAHKLPDLKYLDLRGCKNITEKGIIKLIVRHEKLQVIDLPNSFDIEFSKDFTSCCEVKPIVEYSDHGHQELRLTSEGIKKLKASQSSSSSH